MITIQVIIASVVFVVVAFVTSSLDAQHLRRTDGLLTAIFTGRAVDVIQNTFGSFLHSFDTCFVRKPAWFDPHLGKFDADPSYCDSRCLRSMLCCSPDRVEELGAQLVYTRSEDPTNSTIIFHADKKLQDIYAGRSNKTIYFIVHGFLNHFAYESMWNQTRDGFLQRGSDVISVDWSRGNRLYPQAMANVRVIGALIGRLITTMGISDRSYCVGFSLGAHICGEAGQWLQKNQGTTLARCTGIDPAGPGFDGCGNEIRLDPSDCGVVTAIHTSQFVEMLGFGTKHKSGHCDFWMNDAKEQPNCSHNPSFSGLMWDLMYGNLGRVGQTLEHTVGCSHVRGMKYFISQVSKSCQFEGFEGKCGQGKKCIMKELRSLKTLRMALPPDDDCDNRMNADFRVQTSGIEPFC